MTAPAHTTHTTFASGTTRRRARALAVLAAALVPAGIWLVAVPLLGYELRAPQFGGPPAEVNLPMVVVGALAASLLGWGLLAVLERTRRARTIWTVIALAVLVVSFTPLLDPEIATSTRIVLALMHLAVAAVLIPGLTRDAPRLDAAGR